jgi:serine/threonine protein kinase
MNPTQLKLKERYIIERELGRGGLGVVYLARDTHLRSRLVVIKTMLGAQDRTVNDDWFREKFEKEIEALARINHPGVVGVFDVGQMPDGKPFFVMQYIEGENLRSAMRGRRMELKRAAHIIRQIGYALSAAHEMGVTHRDLKPENIMFQTLRSGEEIVKLIDFGIATVRDLQAGQLNQKTRVAGTIPYMAPEQLRGEPLPASDIWALGIIAYEIITGQLPFQADSVLVLNEMQRAGVSALPKALRPELSPEAQAVILRALAYDPTGRYQDAHEMGEEFMHAILNGDGQSPPSDEISTVEQPRTLVPETAHVLFMDLVGYTQQTMDEQVKRLHKLLGVVSNAPSYRSAQSSNQLIRLPTGDGMALVFFQNPVAPVQCALEISGALKAHPNLPLRMGVHSGPVYRVLDINENMNVAGGGVNLAQRVMDAGDAGHILVSRSVADSLIQLGKWQQQLQDLGEHEVKHGDRIQLFNLSIGDLGNPRWPAKLRATPSPQKVAASPMLFPVISPSLRQHCIDLFDGLAEFRAPADLRSFFDVAGLNAFARCVGRAESLNYDQLISCLLRSGRSRSQPALLDLLEQLASRYREDYKGQACESLREAVGKEIEEFLSPA